MKKEKVPDINESLLDIIKTRDDSLEFLRQIDVALAGLYKHKTSPIAVIEESFSYEKREKVLTLLTQQRIDAETVAAVVAFLTQLKQAIQEIPLVSLTLAFEPKAPFVKKLSSWLMLHTKKPMLLDITVDRYLIGGAIVSSGGRYKDYSLKKILQEKIQQGTLYLSI